MTLPQRKILGHTPPFGIPNCPIFFVTICGDVRGENQFCHPKIAAGIFESAAFYHEKGRWWMHLLLLMPDHVHALVSFPKTEAMRTVVRSGKHYLSHAHQLRWQRDFFDHRLRDAEGYQAKASYVRRNPVRAGLIEEAGKWPFVWEPRRK
jgi:REP element-mobilizing transposase RayT